MKEEEDRLFKVTMVPVLELCQLEAAPAKRLPAWVVAAKTMTTLVSGINRLRVVVSRALNFFGGLLSGRRKRQNERPGSPRCLRWTPPSSRNRVRCSK